MIDIFAKRISAMIGQKRFGRKLSLRSKMEIKRDLTMMGKADDIILRLNTENLSQEEFAAIVSGLIAEHHLTPERAQMLLGLYGRGKAAPASTGEVST